MSRSVSYAGAAGGAARLRGGGAALRAAAPDAARGLGTGERRAARRPRAADRPARRQHEPAAPQTAAAHRPASATTSSPRIRLCPEPQYSEHSIGKRPGLSATRSTRTTAPPFGIATFTPYGLIAKPWLGVGRAQLELERLALARLDDGGRERVSRRNYLEPPRRGGRPRARERRVPSHGRHREHRRPTRRCCPCTGSLLPASERATPVPSATDGRNQRLATVRARPRVTVRVTAYAMGNCLRRAGVQGGNGRTVLDGTDEGSIPERTVRSTQIDSIPPALARPGRDPTSGRCQSILYFAR